MNIDTRSWTQQLAEGIAEALRQYHQSTLKSCPVVVFDLGCFPWHGSIELSFLTAAEVDADPLLFDRSEIASWAHYNFAGPELGQQMAEVYRNATGTDDVRSSVVETFLRASATAVATPEVTDALNELTRDPRFQIWVQHPDTGQEFWPIV